MADKDTIIKIGMDADLSAGVQTEKQLEALRKKAKALGDEGAASAGKASNALGRLQQSAGRLRQALSGFGVAGLFAGLLSQIGRIADSFKSAEKAAEEYWKIQRQLAQDKGLQRLAADYDRLRDAIAAASKEQQHGLDMIEEDVRGRRRLERARRAKAKEAELSALDPDDPAYEQRRAAIEARYAAEEAAASSSDAREDIVLRRQRLASQADDKEGEAKAQDAQSALIRRRIGAAQREKSAADMAAVELNDEDKTGGLSAVGKTMGQLFTGDWGRIADAKTAGGDAIRRDAAQRAASAELKVDELQEELRKSEERAAELRREAARLRERRDKAGDALAAVDAEGEAASSAALRGQTAADRSLARKVAGIARDRKTVSEGTSAIEELEQRADIERARAQAAADTYAKEGADVATAQNRYDMLVANGGSRKERSAALAALQREKEEAQEAQHEMEKVAAEVANVLKSIKEEVGTLSRAVKSAQGRLAQNQADAPEG